MVKCYTHSRLSFRFLEMSTSSSKAYCVSDDPDVPRRFNLIYIRSIALQVERKGPARTQSTFRSLSHLRHLASAVPFERGHRPLLPANRAKVLWVLPISKQVPGLKYTYSIRQVHLDKRHQLKDLEVQKYLPTYTIILCQLSHLRNPFDVSRTYYKPTSHHIQSPPLTQSLSSCYHTALLSGHSTQP